MASTNGRNPDGTFAAGNNANPNGRPKKGEAFSDKVRSWLDERVQLKDDDGVVVAQGTRFELMAAARFRAVLAGEQGADTAFRTFLGYAYGEPLKSIDHRHEDVVAPFDPGAIPEEDLKRFAAELASVQAELEASDPSAAALFDDAEGGASDDA